jgi:orotidine-5'-phosphate decarboxylase
MQQIARRLSVPSFGGRLTEVFGKFGQLCVGIDPSANQLSSWSLPDSAIGARDFAHAILDACAGEVGIVKPQVAFFEQYGPAGLTALAEILQEARSNGFLVIADAKRGDIGSSMAGYTRAWLSEEAIFQADALTLSPFLGVETTRQSIETAMENQRGVFLLAATSNPEASSIQAATHFNESISSQVATYAASFNQSPLGSVGCVVGATVSFDEVGLSQELFTSTPILVPGFGAQGVALSEAGKLVPELTSNLICSVSRSIAGESRTGLSSRIKQAVGELAAGLKT